MNLNNGEFETKVDRLFEISITQESDHSIDGGYTFEDVNVVFELDVENAKVLVKELNKFLDKEENI